MASRDKNDSRLWDIKNNPTPILLAVAGLGLAITVWSFADVVGHATRMAAIQDAALLTESISTLKNIYAEQIPLPAARVPSEELENSHGEANPHNGATNLVREFSDAIAQTDLSSHVEIYGPYSRIWGGHGGDFPDEFARRAWASLTRNPDEPFFEYISGEGGGFLRYAAASRVSDRCVSCHASNPRASRIAVRGGELQSVVDVMIPLSADLVIDPTTDIFQGLAFFAALSLLWFWVAAMGAVAERKKTRIAEAVALRHQTMTKELARAISERGAAASEKDKLGALIQHAQKIESLSQMTGGLAHEFNNLLVPILANANFLKSELPPDSPGQEMIEDIDTAAERAAGLCRQMLAYAGQANIEHQYRDLNQVVAGMAELLEVNTSRTCSLQLDLFDESLYFEFDPVQIEQILVSLVSNASDAMGDRQGKITIRTGRDPIDSYCLASRPFQRGPKVRSGTVNEDLIPHTTRAGVFVEVLDEGEGIAEGDLAKVFDPFFSSRATGRGLGLAAVDGIVRAHGGAISMESELGKFTRIRISFPAESESLSDPLPNSAQCIDSDLQTGTILVADDEPAVRSIATRMLEGFGFKVVTAENGDSATRIFEENPDSFCACLFDVTMPVKDGVRALREIRNLRPSQPAVLFSGYSEKFAEIRRLESPYTTFLEKPFRSEALRAKIVGVLPHLGKTPHHNPEEAPPNGRISSERSSADGSNEPVIGTI
jgi:signal transduction histidine kinase/CheY-like chemotaxis protein